MKKTNFLRKTTAAVITAALILTAISCGSTPKIPEEITIIEQDETPVKYTEEYNKAKVYLIADGAKRIIKLDTTKEAVTSVFEKELPKDAMFLVRIYAGSKSDKEAGVNLIPAAQIAVKPEECTRFIEGVDLFENAADFGTTAEDLNKALSAKETYFAEATIFFTKKETKGVTFGTKYITSNDTVYTPVN